MKSFLLKIKLLTFLAAFLLAPSFAFAATSTVTKIVIMPETGCLRIALAVSKLQKSHLFSLSNPDRFIIDIENGHINPRLLEQVASKDWSVYGISRIRSGHPNANRLRLVFDLNKQIQFKWHYMPDNVPYITHLVADLYFVKPSRRKQDQPVKNINLSHQQDNKFATPLLLPATEDLLDDKKIVVVIDAGHGGKDPGTVGYYGTKEKNVVLAIAIRLAALLRKEPNVAVVMTRQGDYFVPLRTRLRLAHKGKGSIFIAIHADSYFDTAFTGASVYALSQHGATNEAARFLANHNNSLEIGMVNLADLEDKSPVLRSVLLDMSQTATIRSSLRLGDKVLQALQGVTKLHFNKVEQAPFVVLKSPDIPSILVETGFLSNPEEEIRLQNKKYREQIAQAILSGIHDYIGAV